MSRRLIPDQRVIPVKYVLITFAMALSIHVGAFDHTHRAWDKLLQKHVNDKGLVDYDALIEKDRKALESYLNDLGHVSRRQYKAWTRNQKLAYLINAYNAYTIKAIIDHYPIQPSGLARFRFPKNSIRQIPGVWDKLKFAVAGEKMTLNEMEHEEMRAKLKEPRIHFAIVCASIGCPLLRNHAFTAENLDTELDRAAKAFMRNPDKVRIDRDDKELHLSRIFKWFGEDFEKAGGVAAFVARYLPDSDAAYVKPNDLDIEWLDYDWSLNAQ